MLFRYMYSKRKMVELFAIDDPDQMPHSAASDLGLHCLPITLLGFPDYNRLMNHLCCKPAEECLTKSGALPSFASLLPLSYWFLIKFSNCRTAGLCFHFITVSPLHIRGDIWIFFLCVCVLFLHQNISWVLTRLALTKKKMPFPKTLSTQIVLALLKTFFKGFIEF